MNFEKLNKYRNGNFKLNKKHIFAQKNLENIRNYLLTTNNLLGGTAPEPVKNTINSMDNFMDENQFRTLEEQIKTGMANLPELLVKSEDPVFSDLMKADSDLIKEFHKYQDIANKDYEGLDKKEQVRAELLKIQKSLFNLQVKIIFSKLRKIKHVDITPLLTIINTKIESMNKYIDRQESVFEESNPETPNQQNNTTNIVKPDTTIQTQDTNKTDNIKSTTETQENKPVVKENTNVISKADFLKKIEQLTNSGVIDGNKFDNKDRVKEVLNEHPELKTFLTHHKVPETNSLFNSTGDLASVEYNDEIEKIN